MEFQVVAFLIFLLTRITSAGISNASIRDALVDLLAKPISEARSLFIPAIKIDGGSIEVISEGYRKKFTPHLDPKILLILQHGSLMVDWKCFDNKF